jgi:uncharacterized protein with FMN-binding domain
MTRVIVIKKKKFLIIATIILLAIIALLYVLFSGLKKNNSDNNEKVSSSKVVLTNESEKNYVAGIYTSEISVGSYSAELKLLIDENQIKNVELTPKDDAIETMYPLVMTSIEAINEQLRSGYSVEDVSADDGSGYTVGLIMEEIESILEIASTNNSN